MISPPGPAYEKLYLHKWQMRTPPQIATTAAPPWICLIDMNSYFATLEQQANPFLQGKPVGVVKESGRSCIIAASKEAKKLGVKTGCRLADARQLAPNLITVPANFDRYFDATLQLRRLFQSLAPHSDLFSLDEAFLNLSGCRGLYPTPAAVFATAKNAIQQALGTWVTCSCGFGQNRLQAKLAAEFAGPDNWYEITQANLDTCLATAPIEDICGIGHSLSKKLHAIGVTHPFQLNFYDDAFLDTHFGPFWGKELRRMGQGQESHTLQLLDKPPQHMKSVGRSKTLFQATKSNTYLRQLVYNLAEEVCFKARQMQLVGKSIHLDLSDTAGSWHHFFRRFQDTVIHTHEVCHHLGLLLEEYHKQHPTHAPVIKAGIRLSDLCLDSTRTPCWLPQWQQQEKILKAVDALNQKHGLYTVKSARLIGFSIIKPEVTGFLGDKVYQLSR